MVDSNLNRDSAFVGFEPTIVGFEPATQNILILHYNRYQNANQIFEFFAENWTRFHVNKIQNQGLHGGRFKPDKHDLTTPANLNSSL